MAFTLANREEIRRELYRLCGLSESDSSLDEHSDTEGDTANYLIQQALWESQAWYILHANPNRWVTQTSTLSFSGSDSADGGKYSNLPDNFHRLYGSGEHSALRRPDGTRWGREVEPEFRFIKGAVYYVTDDVTGADGTARLWLGREADPPTDLIADYYFRHPVLLDSTETAGAGQTLTVNFPVMDRILIPTIASRLAADLALFPATTEQRAMIARREVTLKRDIAARARFSREPRKVREPPTMGRHWMSTGR